MPTWNEINQEIESLNNESASDTVRKKYLRELSEKVNRPVIAYYSGWLQRRSSDGRVHAEAAITDLDMNGFMSAIHGLDRTRGLDIILHTPGGDIEATRAIVEYLFKMFSRDIRVVVPQIALSAGTMIACASKVVLMAKHSCLGPTDPQVNGYAAMGVLQEIDRAIEEIKKEPLKQLVWQQVFAKYPPAFIANCERARDVTRGFVKAWLEGGMLRDAENPSDAAERIMDSLMDLGKTSSHGYHFMIDDCKSIGLNVEELEADQDLQEAVLSVHHAFTVSFSKTPAIKIIQNSLGSVWSVGG
jgi:ClpP class serine protease